MLIYVGPSPTMLRAVVLWGIAGLLVILIVVLGQPGLSLAGKVLR